MPLKWKDNNNNNEMEKDEKKEEEQQKKVSWHWGAPGIVLSFWLVLTSEFGRKVP